jgi:glycosyltransferase involved in cell wall biosynthesis
VPLLLAAAERLIEGGENLVLWLLGDPSWGSKLLDTLRKEVRAKGLQDRIVFLGYVECVVTLLSRSDVHVCPSIFREPLSNVVVEAKSCGKPSVVFPSGGLPELIEHEVDGFVCRDCTIEALVEGLRYFLADEQVRQRAGLAAKKSLEERFGRNRFQRQWAEVFLASRQE